MAQKNQGIRDIDNFSLCATCPEPVEGCALRQANGLKPGPFGLGFFTRFMDTAAYSC
jgi:hypothetical protein